MMSTPPTRRNNNQLLALVLTLADTTWRIVVPALGLAVLGLLGDLRFGTAPWLTLAGLIVGFVFAGLLVSRQLKDLS